MWVMRTSTITFVDGTFRIIGNGFDRLIDAILGSPILN